MNTPHNPDAFAICHIPTVINHKAPQLTVHIMKKLLKKRWIAALFFLIGSLHLIIVHQTYQPSTYVKREPRAPLSVLDASVEGSNHLKPPTRIVVLGQRASSVDEIVTVLRDAFDLEVKRHKHISRKSMLDESELKTISSQKDILWIVPVQSPCQWAEAMLLLKRSVCEKNSILQNYGLQSCKGGDDSYNYKWEDWQDARRGEELFTPDIEATIAYKNMFEMRRQNLLITQQIMELVPRHVKVVRVGEFELNPNALVKDLEKEYQFTVKNTYEMVPRNAVLSPSLCMSQTKWKEAQTLIDWDIEGYFGHHSLDCHLCHGKGDSNQESTEAPSIIYLLGKLLVSFHHERL